MAVFSVQFEIKNNQQGIARKILKALIPSLNKRFEQNLASRFNASRSKIKTIAGELFSAALRRQPEWGAIINSPLTYELGLLSPELRLENILQVWVDNIEVDFTGFTAVGSNIIGDFTIEIVRSDYLDVTNLPDAVQATKNGDYLEWLRWMLLEGSTTIIGDRKVQFGNWGRTGGAIMVKGGSWAVPTEHAGTANNNFVTRALDEIQGPLKSAIIQCLT